MECKHENESSCVQTIERHICLDCGMTDYEIELEQELAAVGRELDRWKDDYGEMAILLAKRDAELAEATSRAEHMERAHFATCQEMAALREVLDKAEQLAAIDKWPERYPRVYGRMTAALNKEGE